MININAAKIINKIPKNKKMSKKRRKKDELTQNQEQVLITETEIEEKTIEENAQAQSQQEQDNDTQHNNSNILNEIKTKHKKVFIQKVDNNIKVKTKIDRIILTCHDIYNGSIIDCGLIVSPPKSSIAVIFDLDGNILSIHNTLFEVKFIPVNNNKKIQIGDECGYLMFFSVLNPNFIFTKFLKK